MNLRDLKLWTAIITPFEGSGNVDYPTFEKLLRRQEAAGLGIVLLGSTGEGMALEEEEKRELLRFAKSLNLKSPLMAGVGGFNLAQTQRWVQFCEEMQVDSYLFLTPLYAKPGAEGQIAWFRTLLDQVSRPSMLYNVPSRTGVKMQPRALRELSAHPKLWAVKEASGSMAEFQDLRAASPSTAFFSGDDGLTPFFASAGAAGLVSVSSNIWPEATRRYVDLCIAGKHAGLLPTWRTATDALFTASNPIPAKALLHELGIIPNASVRAPLSTRDLPNRDGLREADRLIRAWELSL